MLRRARLLQAYERLMGAPPPAPDAIAIEPERLKRMHRRRAFEIHPDRAGYLGRSAKELEQELKAVNEAYELLRSVARPAVLRPSEARRPEARRHRTCTPNGKPQRPSHHWRGRLPERALPFGEFLYYSQSISWASLVDALGWQKSQRPMLGQLARELGILDGFSIASVQRARQRHERFGEAAVRLGYLTPRELDSLLASQFAYQDRLGSYFVERGSLTRDEVDALSRAHREHNRRHL